jgi:hypothetical protein
MGLQPIIKPTSTYFLFGPTVIYRAASHYYLEVAYIIAMYSRRIVIGDQNNAADGPQCC